MGRARCSPLLTVEILQGHINLRVQHRLHPVKHHGDHGLAGGHSLAALRGEEHGNAPLPGAEGGDGAASLGNHIGEGAGVILHGEAAAEDLLNGNHLQGNLLFRDGGCDCQARAVLRRLGRENQQGNQHRQSQKAGQKLSHVLFILSFDPVWPDVLYFGFSYIYSESGAPHLLPELS